MAEQDERGEDGEAGGREGGKERRTEDGGRGGHHKFCPNFRIRFRSERGLSLLLQGRTSKLLQLFPQYSFAALGVSYLWGIVFCRLQNGASYKAQNG